MLARAMKVFPSVVVSMMLASPALADHVTTRHVGAGRDSGDPMSAGAVIPQPRKAHSHGAPRHGARVIAARRGRYRHETPAPNETAFVDDAMVWTTASHAMVSGSSDSGWHGATQTGMASWYGGSRWHGHMTSSGERFDQNALTAAHATLPLGAIVRVTLLDGSGSVVVRITDRPGTRRRIIDLSRAAAAELGILDRGVAMVSLAPL